MSHKLRTKPTWRHCGEGKLLMLIFMLWKKNEPYQLPIKFLEQPVEAALTGLD